MGGQQSETKVNVKKFKNVQLILNSWFAAQKLNHLSPAVPAKYAFHLLPRHCPEAPHQLQDPQRQEDIPCAGLSINKTLKTI